VRVVEDYMRSMLALVNKMSIPETEAKKIDIGDESDSHLFMRQGVVQVR